MHLIFKTIIVLGYLLGTTKGTGNLYIDYEYFDTRGRDSGGDLCDYCIFCYNPCDPVFDICLRFGHTTQAFTCSSSGIRSPQIHSGEYVNTDKPYFGSSIGGTSNPVHYPTPNWFNGLFEISIFAKDEDGIFSADDDIDHVLFRITASVRTSYSSFYTASGTRGSSPATAAVRYLFFCDTNYYGSTCGVYCLGRDDTSGHYYCNHLTGAIICYTGYTGTNCDVGTCGTGYEWNAALHRCVDINECSIGTSNCEQSCINNAGSYTCSCSSGYQLYNSFFCSDIIECSANPCAGTCTNTIGSYQCACGNGYRVDTTDMRRCNDIDECQESLDNCDHNCVNSPGSFYCGCSSGYVSGSGGACNDIDECALDTDQCDQLCANTMGSYTCDCTSNYYLSSTYTCSQVNFSVVVTGTGLSSTSIRLAWTTDYFPSSNPVSLSYQVWLRDVTFSTATSYANHAQIANNLQIDATNLLPYRRYQLYISAVGGLATNDSNIVTVRTNEDSPSTGPSHVDATALNATQIRVHWSAPSTETQNGMLTTYTLQYTTSQQRQMNGIGNEISVSASITSYILSGLSAYTEYWLSVAASTSVGRGPYTNRSSAVRTYESIPTAAPGMTVASKTSTSITLTLQPPTNTALINGVITYYSVSFTGINVDTSTTNLRVTPSSGNYLSPVTSILSPLQEGVSYNIEAIMYTIVGGGPSSSILTVTTQESVPADTPQNIQFTSVQTTSLSLSWDPPPLMDRNGVILGYRLSYRGVSVDTVWRNSTLNTNNVALNNLEEGCQYMIYICAFTSVGDGPCTRLTHSTLEIIPSGGPTMLTIENAASTSISFSWSPPPPSQQNGIITGYNIKSIGQVHDTERFEVNVSATTYLYQLNGLEEYEGYSISIRARNSIGYGPFAELNGTTSEALPNSPKNLTGISGQTTITLSWIPIPADQQNGQLLSYEINYFSLTPFISHEHVLINVSDTNTQHTLAGLEQAVEYTLKVRAYTSIGPGPYSLEITVTTKPSEPSSAPTNLQALSLSSTQIQVMWNPPSAIDQNGPITQYQIFLSPSSSTLSNTIYTTSQTIHTINALHPYTRYSVQVRAENSVGAGPNTSSVSVTTRQAIPSAPPTHLTLVSATHSSADISWRSPMADSLNGPLQGYTLNVTNTLTSTSFIETAATFHTLLDSLTPNTRYSLIVAAVNSQGIGPYSSELFFSTQQSSPTQPPHFTQISDDSPHSISLQWNAILEHFQNGPILSYTVNISTSEDDLLVSSQTVLHPTTTATFTNLHPYTEYTLAVSGNNAAGTSPSDYRTHTTEEDSPTGAPTSLSAVPSFTSIALSWQPPNIDLQNGIIIEYSIQFQYSNYVTNMTEYVITGLEEFTMFQWSVAARTSIGIGPYSDTQTVSTLSNPPSQPPQNVTGIALSYQSIFVSWDPIPLLHQNGRILNCIVYFQMEGEKDNELKQEVDSSEMNTTLSPLKPFQSYSIYVVCENTEGSSPESSTVSVMTLEGSPSAAPTDLLVTSTSSTSARVSWVRIPHDQHNGILVYYEIVYQGRTLHTAILTFRASANQTSAVLVDLHPAVEYTVYIRAFTQVGNGPDSPIFRIALPESIPNASPTFIESTSQSDSIFLTWSPVNDIDQNGIIIIYELRYSLDNGNSHENLTYRNVSAASFNTTFTELMPNTYFEFEIRAFTNVGPGPYSSKYFISTKPHICTVCDNGFCVQDLNDYSCECNPGYLGETCSADINDCITNGCEHGICKDSINQYTCECNSGYKGQLCDILSSTPTCSQEVSLNFEWPETAYGSSATLPCSDFDADLYGEATRACDSVGIWSLVDLSQCKRKLFDTLDEFTMGPGVVDLTPGGIVDFIQNRLCNGSFQLSGPPYTPGEMDVLIKLINELISEIERQDKKNRVELIERTMPGVLCVLSNVLDVGSLEIFLLSNATQQAIALGDLIERIAKLNAQNFNSTSPHPLLYSHENLQMSVAPLTNKQSATIPDYELAAAKDTGLYPDSVYIPESEVSALFSKANGDTPVIALVFSRYLGQALGSPSTSSFSSRVITVQSSIGNPLGFTSPITLTFTLFPVAFSPVKSKCVYWDVNTEDWSSSGLNLESEESDHVSCSSVHATSFAILSSQSSVVPLASTQTDLIFGVGAASGVVLLLISALLCCFLIMCLCRLRQRKKKAAIGEYSRRQSHDGIINVSNSVPNPLYGHVDNTFGLFKHPAKGSYSSLDDKDMDSYYSKLDHDLDKDAKNKDTKSPREENAYSTINPVAYDNNAYSEIVPDPALNPFIDISSAKCEKNETISGINHNPFETALIPKASGGKTGIENPTYDSQPIHAYSSQPMEESTEPLYSRISGVMEHSGSDNSC